MAERCGSFLPEEVDVRVPSTLLDEGVKRGDRLAVALSRWQEVVGSGAQSPSIEAAYSDVLATKDSHLIERVGRQLITVAAVAHDGRVPLAGRWFDVKEVEAAWSFASCQVGADCGPTNDTVLGACAFFGDCHPTLQEATRAAYVREHGDATWGAVIEAADLIAGAVGRGDASAFFSRGVGQASGSSK
jgi:hypothetical protein